ncbi:MAG TPA: transcriptional regulator [Ruminococcaceae bacterium]|nr:transcriptional regulator [Oscillospiraceae bacterium]
MTIGERIRQLREERKISQTELAEAAETTKQNLYKYENGIITNIPTDKIEKMAKKLSVSPAYLMGWKEESLNRKDEADIADAMERFIEQLSTAKEALMFDGEPLDDESRDLLLASLENSLRMGKRIAKQKYSGK